MRKYNGGDGHRTKPRNKKNINVKRQFKKIDSPKDKESKYIHKERDGDPIHDGNPLEDMEIIRAMGMNRCKVCMRLYPVYLNRCPNCKDK
jgi:hypothetical protein